MEDPLSNQIFAPTHSLEVLDALVDGLDVVGERAGAGGAVRALPARLVRLLDLFVGLFALYDLRQGFLSLFGDVVRNVFLLLVGGGGGGGRVVVRLQVNVQVGPDKWEGLI